MSESETSASLPSLIKDLFSAPRSSYSSLLSVHISSNDLLRHLILNGAKLKLDEQSKVNVESTLKEMERNGFITTGTTAGGDVTLASMRFGTSGSVGKRKQRDDGDEGEYWNRIYYSGWMAASTDLS